MGEKLTEKEESEGNVKREKDKKTNENVERSGEGKRGKR